MTDVTPTGTITFLRTGVEGSMRLVRSFGPSYASSMRPHRAIVRAAIEAYGGRSVRTQGDALHVLHTDALAGATSR